MRKMIQTPQALILIAALALLCGLPGLALADEAAVQDNSAEVEAVQVEAVQDVESSEVALEEEAAAWGGPEAPLLTAMGVARESGSDCDSSQGYCSSSAQCWAFCRALTGEIGFCNQIYNCCVCPEIRY